VGIGTYEELYKVCEVTADQRKKIAEVYASGRKACSDADKAQRDYQADVLQKAYESRDEAAIAKARTEYTKLATTNGHLREKAQTDILAVLTLAQRAEWQKYLILKAIERTFPAFKFTDEQWNKIFDAYAREANSPVQRTDLVLYALRDRVTLDVLTSEQRSKHLLATRYDPMAKVCRFTDEQTGKIVQIEEERLKAVCDNRDKTAETRARLLKYMDEAQAANDKEAQANLSQKLADLDVQLREVQKKFDEKVQAALTDAQRTAWQEHIKTGGAFRRPAEPKPAS